MNSVRVLRQKRSFDSHVEPCDLFAGPVQQLSVSELLQYPLQTSLGDRPLEIGLRSKDKRVTMCCASVIFEGGWPRKRLVTRLLDCAWRLRRFGWPRDAGRENRCPRQCWNRLAQSMQGGMILVRGNAGDRIGSSESANDAE